MWWAKWAMHASKHLTDSHQTNPPSALVQAPCACINHRQSFCILRFLTKRLLKAFLLHEKKIAFKQKIKPLCICYLNLSFMDYKISCQMMRHNFVSPFHKPGWICLSTIHSGDSYWKPSRVMQWAPRRGQECQDNSSLIQGQYLQKDWQPFVFGFLFHTLPHQQ